MKKKLDSRCQSCGYTLSYDPDTQSLKCPQCGSLRNIESEDRVEKKAYDSNLVMKKSGNGDVNLECSSCGAKTASLDIINGVCPYCGSTNLNYIDGATGYKPDGVLPFSISKETALKKFKDWISTRKFVPNKLKLHSKINMLEGHYIPCWDYDFNVSTKFSGIGYRNHTRTYTTRGSNGQVITHSQTYTTSHPFSGSRQDEFEGMKCSASNLISNYDFKNLGRWKMENLRVYNPEYLLGFFSSEYDIDLHSGFDTTSSTAKSHIERRIKSQYSYDSYSNINMDCKFSSVLWRYLYLPVWLCKFSFQQKYYNVFINGSTGYVTGKVPRSAWKIGSLVVGILLGIAAIVAGFIYLSNK